MNISNSSKITADLAIGPMSREAVEAVFRYSHFHRKQLMLIASKNQIDHKGGYVNNWNTKEYMGYIRKMRDSYPQSKVLICRDHCGPGFNGNYNLKDVYKTIEEDLNNDFDLIHIDFCHYKGSYRSQLEEAKKAIKYMLKLKPDILIEIGTDENIGTSYSLTNLEEIESEIDFFQDFCQPVFYVIQTGSLIKEMDQAGTFNKVFARNAKVLLNEKAVKLKEHNSDYLSKEQLLVRLGSVDAMNIAPQFGVVQTQLIINRCMVNGIDFTDFLELAYKGNKWKKWLFKNGQENKLLCSTLAGHYHFASDSYKKIMTNLEKREDIHEKIINTFMDLIDHYENK